MVVRGHFRRREGVRGLAARLPERKTGAGMVRDAALQIRQIKGGGAVASVGGAQKGEEGLVLVDGHCLPVAKSPAFRREVESEQFDLPEKWCRHKMDSWFGLVSRRKDPKQGDDEIHR